MSLSRASLTSFAFIALALMIMLIFPTLGNQQPIDWQPPAPNIEETGKTEGGFTLPETEIPIDPSHNPEHTPGLSPQATQTVNLMIAVWESEIIAQGGTPPAEGSKVKCVVMKYLGKAARYIVWLKTGMTQGNAAQNIAPQAKGVLAWWDKFGWRDAYGPKTESSILNIPNSEKAKLGPNGKPAVTMEPISCNSLTPPGPPILQP